jgi:serine/threonine protein kinase
MRANVDGPSPRYALKQLKPTDEQKYIEQGLIDLSIEAMFLANLNHPSIIRLRGLTGTPLSPNFGLVLDRLYMTLEDQMNMWTAAKKRSMKSGLCGCLGLGKMDKDTEKMMLVSVVTAAYDLSCAMRYLHGQNLLYRDTKPENAGFDVRGDIKIFDFGFCKELTQDLYDKTSGQYNLTKRTGSQPYLAPENFVGKPYGKASDVFSFGVLLFEMLHCKFAFYHLSNPKDYTDLVCNRDYRPEIDKSLPMSLQRVISQSWDPDYNKRPSFKRIAALLGTELRDMTSNRDELSRSEKLVDQSARSIKANNRRNRARY